MNKVKNTNRYGGWKVSGIKHISPTCLLIEASIILLFSKQLIVNMVGGKRHAIATIIMIAVIVSIYIAIIVIMKKAIMKRNVFAMPLKKTLYFFQFFLVFYWIGLIFVTPNGGTLIQRVVSSSYAAGFTLIIWIPIVFLNSLTDVKRLVRTMILITGAVGIIGIIQWFIPEANLPWLLQGDQTVFQSATVFGTARVNGLIGTPLEFAFLMTMMAFLFLIRLEDRISFTNMLMLAITIFCISITASRAFWLITAFAMIVLIVHSRKKHLLTIPLIITCFLLISTASRDFFLIPLTMQHPVYKTSVVTKTSAISEALSELNSSPLIGTGLGFQTAPVFGDASRKIISDGFWWALLLEGGIIGIFLLFTLIIIFCLIFFEALRRKNGCSKYSRQLAKWGITFIGIAFLGNISNSSLNNQILNIIFYLMIGTVLAAINIEFREDLVRRRWALRRSKARCE